MPDFKRIPAGETIWEQLFKEGDQELGKPPLYLVTSDKRREKYHLWKRMKDGSYAEVMRSSDPTKLRSKIVLK